MSDLERDHVLRRAVQTLRHLPTPREDAISRVVAAAAAQRVMPAADDPSADESPSGRSGQRRWRIAGFAGLVAAAAIVGFVVRGPITRTPPTASVESNAAPDGPQLRAAVNGASDVLPVPQQFVFRSASAHRVSVVGDFNRWNASSASMARAAGGDLWSITIPIVPGRHTYGFMVDDSIFTLDPDSRVARARDPDLGAEGSVVMVRP